MTTRDEYWQSTTRIKSEEREFVSRNAPTYENQLWHARRLVEEKGLEALRNPHALTGKICGCGSCFCCAALEVYEQKRANDNQS